MLEKRKARRAAVALMATLNGDKMSKTVRLHNLTSNGALIEGEALPLQGSDVQFKRNGLSAKSRVVWAEGARRGILFEQPIPFKATLRHIAKPKTVSGRYSDRPGLKCRPLTEADKRIMDIWGINRTI